jgi:hypothetical protein
MTTVIVYQDGDGVAVVYPTGEISLEEVAEKDLPAGASRAFIDSAELPDYYFREAWEYDGPKGAKINVEKAKGVQSNLWRRLRAPKLAALDIEFMQAIEDANPARRNTIKAKKQALRDVTETPLPDDLEGIKNTLPTILTEP